MPLLSLSGIHPTDWVEFADDQPVDEGAYAAVSAARLAEDGDTLFAAAGQVAAIIDGDADGDVLAPYIDRLAAIWINFKAFNDGRGFSLALRFKRDMGFKGEVRAIGKVIPDQAQFLARSGFDSVEVAEERVAAFETALSRYTSFYQCTINGDMSVAHRRHMRADKGAA